MNKFPKLIFIFIIGYLIISSGCKDENNVEPVVDPNTQNPNSPVLLSPNNGAVVTGTTPVLDWEDYSNAVSYRLQVSLDGNINGTILLDTTLTASRITFPPGRMVTGVNIYWRVIANLQGNQFSNWSAIWKFISRLDPPPPPFLITPANGSSNIHFIPFFDWSDAPTADFYRIQISGNPAFTNILFDTNNIHISEYQSSPGYLITGTQYFWRVNASNTNGLSVSDWSAVFNFTTINGPIPSSISGRVTFVDTNFAPPPTYYIVGLYTAWPPLFSFPDRFTNITIQQQGNIYYADYHLFNIPNNVNYRMTLSFVDVSDIKTMGIYGCDTAHVEFSTCPADPDSLILQNYNGIENINFLSWADTSKFIY